MTKRKDLVDFPQAESLLFLVAVTTLAFAVRLKFLPFGSADSLRALQVWFAQLKQSGGLAAAGRLAGGYLPPYFYLLALMTYLPGRDLYLIKLLSFAGDIVLAVFALKIVRLKYAQFWGEIAYAAVLLLPSVVLNSGAWGQCDSFYTAALLACVYFLLRRRPYAAVTAWSVAFVFKPQAIFLAPFLLLMLLCRRIPWRSLLAVPAVYLLAVLPAAASGQDFGELLTVYARRAAAPGEISMYLPNLSVWYPKGTPQAVGTAIVIAAAAAALAGVFWFWRKKFELTDEMLVSLALLSVLFVPYVLPYMRERYYYPADILSVVFAFYFPEKFYVPVITVFSSTYVVCHSLFNTHFLHIRILSVLMLFCLLWVGISTVYLSRDEKIEKAVRRKWLS